MFNISLEHGYSLTTMAAVAGAAILLAGVFYRRAFAMLRPWQWYVLFALRAAAIVLIVLLLFRPVLSYSRHLQQQKAIVFLLDTSRSMGIADDATGVTRFNQARSQIEKWREELGGDFKLCLLGFAQRVQPLEGLQQLAALRPDGESTSLCAALDSAAKMFKPDDVEALVMFSDGAQNAAGDPLLQAKQTGMTVHAVGVGTARQSDVSYRDVQLAGIDCPDRLLLDNLAKITASVEGIGLLGRVIKVVLQEDGKPIGEKELTLDAIEGSQQVTFDFRPATAGRHTYTVGVPVVAQERIEQNNRRSAAALVVEPGIRVLYVEGTIRPEYGAVVQRFLAKDPDLEFYALVQTRPNFFIKRTNIPGLALDGIPSEPKTIEQFDVFILGDIDASYFRPEQQDLFVKRIRSGAGLLMLGGYHGLGPGGWAGTPVGDILPMRLGNRQVGQITEPFLPVLTPDGVRHPIFSGISGFFPTQQRGAAIAGLPPLDGCTRVESARPGATVLATLPEALGSMPLMAVAPSGRGRAAVFCGDTTRRWQQAVRAMDRESPFLRFWGQTVRYLVGRESAIEAAAGVVVATDKAYYRPGEPIVISAVARDAEGEAARGAGVVAKILGPGGRPDQVELSAVPGPGGHYSGRFEPDASGRFEIAVEARLGESTIPAEKLVVEVGRPNMEFEQLNLNDKLLGRIASATGGRYVHLSTADHLLGQFDRSLQKRRQYVERRLYWPPLCWVLFLGVLTTEWILRRRFQLR